MTASGPSVWTDRALQAESDDLEMIGLAHGESRPTIAVPIGIGRYRRAYHACSWLLRLVLEVDAAQDNARGLSFGSIAKNLRPARSSIWSRSRMN
jgi:hypothetical protein